MVNFLKIIPDFVTALGHGDPSIDLTLLPGRFTRICLGGL